MKQNDTRVRKMEKEMSIHNKAIRLVEGGIVEVDCLCIKLSYALDEFDPCLECKMDSLCYMGTEMCYVCQECDMITGKACYLTLVEADGK